MANKWGNNGNSERLYFGGLPITADGDYSHETKRHLLLGRKAMIHEGETMTDFIFLGSKIIADSDCSHETKRHLLLGRKAMTELYSILKSRDTADKGPARENG